MPEAYHARARRRSVMRSRRTVAVFLAGFLGAGCKPPPLPPPLETLRNAPAGETLEGGTAVTLYAYLWRDFMPASPPDGKPLIASLEVRAVNPAALPTDLSIEAAFVVLGDEVWSSSPQVEGTCPSPDCIRAISREGPRWGPDVTVDVVVQIASGSSPSVLLRQPGVPISRTD